MKHIKKLLRLYAGELRKIYGERLVKVVLYGSYARGDYRAYSDVNVLVLVDGREDELQKFNDALFGMTFDFNMDNDIDIQVVPMSTEYYHKWEKAHPLLLNIKEDGWICYKKEG